MPVTHPALRIECPTRDELRGLMHDDLPRDRADEITAHIGDCSGCQRAMDLIATGDSPVLVESVRHIDRIDPPRHSALWQALDQSISVITRAANGDTPRTGELKLDFLSRSNVPGRIGRLGGFEVNRLIGRGGMGVVLHAFDPVLQRDVALKILDPQLAFNDTARQRFCREARAAASVSSENIVTVHQVDEDPKSGLPFLVMQLVTGESLDQRLRRVGKLSVPDAVRLGAQAAAGLAAAHATGLIHRDVKPGNILLEEGTDRVKLTDFGLARATEDLKLTKTGFVSGTPLYMAPEQARGDDLDARADLFSLGVVLYEAVTGQPPFDGKTPLAVLRRVADDPHTPVHKLTPEVPDWFESVIDRLLTKEPADRFQTAAELHAVLDAHVTHPSSTACDAAGAVAAAPCPFDPPSGLSRRAKRRWQLKLGGLMAAAVLFGGALGTVGGIASGLFTETVTVPGDPPPPIVQEKEVAKYMSEPVGDTFLREFNSQNGTVLSVSTCPDGEHLAVGLEDGSIRVFNINSGKYEFDLAGHGGPVFGLEFFRDKKHLVSASDDGMIRVWDITAARGKPERTFDAKAGLRAVAVDPTGEFLVTGDRSGKVKVWSVAGKGDEPTRTFSHDKSVSAVAFSTELQSADGLLVASAGADGMIKLWDVKRGEPKGKPLLGGKGPAYAVAFSSKDDVLASAGWDGVIRVWNLNDLTEKRAIMGHDGSVWSLAFSECGGMLASAGQDGTVRVWDVNTGEKKFRVKAHTSVAHVVRWSKGCGTLVSGGRDGVARQWLVEK